MHKSKFDKTKCRKCRWGMRAGYARNQWACGYCHETGIAAIKEGIDSRGEDFNNCKLYERRTKEDVKQKTQICI